MKQAVLSLSGGMDSTALLLHLLANDCSVTALSFHYGQKHSIELERAKACIQYLKEKGLNVNHKIVDLSSAMSSFNSALTSQDIEVPQGHYAEDNMKQTVVPNRNAIFLSIIYGEALSISQVTNKEVFIAIGVHAGDHAIYPDCRGDFRDAIFKAFTIGNWGSDKINFHTPYLYIDKKEILSDAVISCQRLQIDFEEVFKNTNTCYNPDTTTGKSCGKCGSCVERVEAFIKINKQDPVQYMDSWEIVKEYVSSVLNKK